MVAEFLRPVQKFGNENVNERRGEGELGHVGGSGEHKGYDVAFRRKGEAGSDGDGQGGSQQGRSGGKQGIADLFRHDVGKLIPTDNYVATNVINGNDSYSVGGPIERREWLNNYGARETGRPLSPKSGGWESAEEKKHVDDYRMRVALNTERWGGRGNMDQNLLAQGYYNKPTLKMPAIPIRA